MTSEPIDLDARVAAAIAAGMMAVALADGEVHPREVALVEAFRATLPDDVDPTGVALSDPDHRAILLRSLFHVALVDEMVTSEERATIDELARAHGASDRDVAEAEAGVRAEMVRQAARARGRHEARALATRLAITDDEFADLLA